jgi:hypothetical protein
LHTNMSQQQASGPSIDDLLDEIAFQETLLASIDDSVQNRHEAENECRAEIKALQTQLRVKQGITTASSSQSYPSSQQPDLASSNSSYHARSSDIPSDIAMASSLGQYTPLSPDQCGLVAYRLHLSLFAFSY